MLKLSLLFHKPMTARTRSTSTTAVQALKLSATDPSPRLYLVVPPQSFGTFRRGPVHLDEATTPHSSIPLELEYWVLECCAVARL